MALSLNIETLASRCWAMVKAFCHVYVDQAADSEKALNVAFDSKVQYPAACNAMETLLVHRDIAHQFLPLMIQRFRAAAVEVRGCPETVAYGDVVPASKDDWATEYSNLIVSIKIVNSLEEAIKHVDTYGSGHTESIVTENKGGSDAVHESC